MIIIIILYCVTITINSLLRLYNNIILCTVLNIYKCIVILCNSISITRLFFTRFEWSYYFHCNEIKIIQWFFSYVHTLIVFIGRALFLCNNRITTLHVISVIPTIWVMPQSCRSLAALAKLQIYNIHTYMYK